MICTEAELEEDGFTERFKFDTTPLEGLWCATHHHLKTLSFLHLLPQLLQGSLMKTTMLHHHHLLQHIPALHRQTTPPTLLRLGTRSKLYVFKPFWSLLTKGGEAYEIDSLQAGSYRRVHYILLCAYNSRFLLHLVLWVVNTKTRWSSATCLPLCLRR